MTSGLSIPNPNITKRSRSRKPARTGLLTLNRRECRSFPETWGGAKHRSDEIRLFPGLGWRFLRGFTEGLEISAAKFHSNGRRGQHRSFAAIDPDLVHPRVRHGMVNGRLQLPSASPGNPKPAQYAAGRGRASYSHFYGRAISESALDGTRSKLDRFSIAGSSNLEKMEGK